MRDFTHPQRQKNVMNQQMIVYRTINMTVFPDGFDFWCNPDFVNEAITGSK